jgi:WD40 repeat protein/CHAT domain-containing protein
MMIPGKFPKGNGYFAIMMSAVFITATNTPINAQPQIPRLSQSPTTRSPDPSETQLPEQSFGGQLAVFVGHEGGVNSAVFSPDGNQILTASGDKTVRLWDTSGNLLTVLRGHEDEVNSAVFSPDGNRILTASGDNTVRLWDTSGKLIAEFRGHEKKVNSAVFSPDGNKILTASQDGTVRLWDTSGKLLTGFQTHEYGSNSAVFSPDGNQILTADGNTARLWDTSGKLLVEFRGHENVVASAVFSPDGRYILTASWDKTVRLWDTSGNLLKVLQGHKGEVTSAVFSPDGNQILTAGINDTTRLWDTSGKLIAEFRGFGNGFSSAVFSPNGNQILTSRYVDPRLWDISAAIAAQTEQISALGTFEESVSQNNAQILSLEHPHEVRSAVFSPDGRYILTTSLGVLGALFLGDDLGDDKVTRLWDTSGKLLIEIRGHGGDISGAETIFLPNDNAVFSPDGRYILTADKDTITRLWDTSGNLVAEFQGHAGNITSAEFSPDGNQILTASEDGTARLWETSGKLIAEFQWEYGYTVTRAVFSPDGKQILTASPPGNAHLWDSSGTLIREFQGDDRFGVNSAIFSPDGTQILTTDSLSSNARLWDTSGNLLAIFRGHEDQIDKAEFSPDGHYILTTSFLGSTVYLWNTSGNLVAELQNGSGIGSGSTIAKFSPNGRYILTADRAGTVRLWNISGNLLVEFRGHENGTIITSAVFSPDSNRIITTSDDKTARLWDVSTAIALQSEQMAAQRNSQATVSDRNAPQAVAALQAAIQLNQQGTVESRQQVLQQLEEALNLYRADNNAAKAAHTLLLIGNIHANLGQFQAALDAYNQALPLSQQAGAKAEEAAILNSLGQLYNDLADPKTALDYHKQALPLLYQLNDKGGAANTFNNIGDIQAATGQWESALDSYNKALIISRSAGDLTAEATALMGIGSTYIASKEWSTALNAYNQSLIIARHLKDKIKETTILNQMGKIHAALGDNSTALEHYNQALALAQQLGYKTEEANIHYNQAILNRQQNNLTAAKTDIETSIQIIEALRTQIASQELRQSYFARNQDYYQLYIDILMQLHQQNPSQGYDALALHASERARARILLEQLTEASLDLKANLDPALAAEEQRLTQALNAADQKRINLLNQEGGYGNPELEAAKAEIDDILSQLQRLEAQIRSANPAYANIKYPDPLTLDGIQTQILDDNTLLLQYALGKERSYLFLVSKTDLKTYELPPKAEIEAAVEQYRQLLLSPEFKDLSQGQRLSEMLLGQIAGELNGQRLVIVGDGKLQLLPFAALPWGSGASLAPLLANHEIITLPSATSLAVQREQWQNRQPAPRTLAVIADPVFKANDPRLGANATSIAGDLSQVDSLIRNSCGDFDRLPHTATEAEQILALVPDAQEFSALGFDANYATATNPNLSQYRIVHLATHGCIQDNPLLSNLALSFFNAGGQRSETSSLKLQDIYNLELNADLVVLSACQTGTGKEVQGEGIVGLTRGFMYAGARRVAVSLWSVNDRATSILMSDYYRQMLEQKVDPAAALRQAQLTMWQSESYSAPYYWAAFTLQGDW